ncbi:hypothetical protein CPHO_08000 [Corynebacterium phocae]|uniref:Uncharacterized protein n=1 Tax=Corynebacterium phocae TaxID=161895 RepID=A0A1L7D443_9CORY|nr:hypothetical protein [Corynebacterium phocae]APT92837.1 hypothetical protein CPHO_08000 [Corynebacterium phocae]KAA8723155.1 hypothetical protein F4V58_07505 [Corynebacterium phocae]
MNENQRYTLQTFVYPALTAPAERILAAAKTLFAVDPYFEDYHPEVSLNRTRTGLEINLSFQAENGAHAEHLVDQVLGKITEGLSQELDSSEIHEGSNLLSFA